MRNILCTHGKHHVPIALIHDMNVLKRVCLDCYAWRIANPTVRAPKAPDVHPVLPSRIFRVMPR